MAATWLGHLKPQKPQFSIKNFLFGFVYLFALEMAGVLVLWNVDSNRYICCELWHWGYSSFKGAKQAALPKKRFAIIAKYNNF